MLTVGVLTPSPRGDRRGVQELSLVMGEHRPESSQRLGGDARAELGDLALEVGADEVFAPA